MNYDLVKMPFLRILAVLALMINLLSCDALNDDKEKEQSWVSISEVEIVEIRGNTVEFMLKGSLPTPCHTISGHTRQQNGQTITLRFQSSAPTSPCLTMVQPFEQAFEMSIPSPGTYSVLFWQLGDSYLSKSVTIL